MDIFANTYLADMIAVIDPLNISRMINGFADYTLLQERGLKEKRDAGKIPNG